MTVTIFSNFINHYQSDLSDYFYEMLGDNFTFIATEPIDQSFKKYLSTDFSDKKYLLNSYESDANYEKALLLGSTSDIVILGSAPDIFIKERLKSNKITFRYSERWFKKKGYEILSPRFWLFAYRNFIKYRNNRYYMLCASAYTPYDTNKFFAFRDKCYKWGYFPKVKKIDVDSILSSKKDQKFRLVWVARWIDWKHPEMAVQLVAQLKSKGHDIILEMAGDGNMREEILKLIDENNLVDNINVLGNIQNDDILKKMRESNAFILTSDRGEGWGAVVNEAMSNACTVVASHEIGSVPYLIQHEFNGLIFESKDLTSLVNQVERLVNDKSLCNTLAKNAYQSINEIWSPQIAASNFIDLANSLMIGEDKIIVNGPCSKAEVIIEKDFLKRVQ